MDKTKRRELTRDDKLYILQFALIGSVVTALILMHFGIPPIFVAGAATALTAVSFVRGRLNKRMLPAFVSLPLLVSAITLVIVS